MRNIPLTLSKRSKELATALGLDASTFYGLAFRAGVAGLAFPGEVAERLHDEVTEFRAALRRRAVFARRVAETARTLDPTRRRYEWDE